LSVAGTLTSTGTSSFSANPTFSGGTANGVAYLNGSKVVTSGSALTFNGTTLTLGGNGSFESAFSGNGLIVSKTNVGAVNAIRSVSDTSNILLINDSASGFANTAFYSSGSEAMRLTSTGLGIGTSSPADKLQVLGTIRFGANATYYGTITHDASSTGANIYNHVDSGGHLFQVGGSTLLNLTASGNLGLGVTPTNNTLGKTLQVGQAGAWTAETGTNRWWLGSNWYYNSGDKYINNGHATLYSQQNGTHTFFTAPSGTAGNAITFTQAATLNANGNFLVGCTSFPSASVAGIGITGTSSGNASSSGASTSAYNQWLFYNGNGIVGSISTSGSTTTYSTSSDYRLKNITGSITTSGAYIDSLNPVEGTWKADGSTFVGLIAHEVQEVSRTQVATGVKDGAEMQAMDYSNSELIANLIAEVKSLRQRVATLEAK
jgi:hypothetical protein